MSLKLQVIVEMMLLLLLLLLLLNVTATGRTTAGATPIVLRYVHF